jgi:hypothetical protein
MRAQHTRSLLDKDQSPNSNSVGVHRTKVICVTCCVVQGRVAKDTHVSMSFDIF